MHSFSITDLPLEGLKLVTRQPLGDSRGFLARLFCATELLPAGWSKPVAQINHTHTAKAGTIRGLHFQKPPHAEMKLVSCIRGEVFDVAVDLRAGSETFLHWHGEILSAQNGRALLIPEGFAHGFQTICDDCEILYLHSAPYSSLAEAGLLHDDPKLKIAWPLPVSKISARDLQHPSLDSQFKGLKNR